MSDVVLEVNQLEKSFGKHKVVDQISFSIEKGDIFGLIGPNGAGKTTTIRMLLGLLQPEAGSVKINGYDIKKEFYSAIGRIGALIEGPAFYDYLTAMENLKIFQAYSGLKEIEEIYRILELVELYDRRNDKVKHYSLGMKQRLGLAQALLNKPELLILDEPTNGLDPQGIKDIRKLLKSLSKEGITILFSSHILSEVENMCHKILVLNKGKKVVSGLTKDLITQGDIYDINPVNKEQLILCLKKMASVEIIKNEDVTSVRVKLKTIVPEDLLTYLVKEDVKIKSYQPVRVTLEDYFFEATGGER